MRPRGVTKTARVVFQEAAHDKNCSCEKKGELDKKLETNTARLHKTIKRTCTSETEEGIRRHQECLPSRCPRQAEGNSLHMHEGFPLTFQGVSRRVSRGFRGFPNTLKRFCKTMKTDAPLHNHKKVRGFQAKLDMTNPDGNRAPASTKGFPSVCAAPLYIIRRGKHVGSGVHLCSARTQRHRCTSRILRKASF